MDKLSTLANETENNEPIIDMVIFRNEVGKLCASIAKLLSRRRAEGKEGSEYIDMPELVNIKPDDLINLTEADARMWYRVTGDAKDQLTPFQLTKYLAEYREDIRKSRNNIRLIFLSVIVNKAQFLGGNSQLNKVA